MPPPGGMQSSGVDFDEFFDSLKDLGEVFEEMNKKAVGAGDSLEEAEKATEEETEAKKKAEKETRSLGSVFGQLKGAVSWMADVGKSALPGGGKALDRAGQLLTTSVSAIFTPVTTLLAAGMMTVADIIFQYAEPALEKFADILATKVVPAVLGFAQWIADTPRRIREQKETLTSPAATGAKFALAIGSRRRSEEQRAEIERQMGVGPGGLTGERGAAAVAAVRAGGAGGPQYGLFGPNATAAAGGRQPTAAERPGASIMGEFAKNLSTVVASMRKDLSESMGISPGMKGIEGRIREMQQAALGRDPIEQKQLDMQGKILSALERMSEKLNKEWTGVGGRMGK